MRIDYGYIRRTVNCKGPIIQIKVTFLTPILTNFYRISRNIRVNSVFDLCEFVYAINV